MSRLKTKPIRQINLLFNPEKLEKEIGSEKMGYKILNIEDMSGYIYNTDEVLSIDLLKKTIEKAIRSSDTFVQFDIDWYTTLDEFFEKNGGKAAHRQRKKEELEDKIKTYERIVENTKIYLNEYYGDLVNL